MANSLNPTNAAPSDAVAAVTSSLQSATISASPGSSGSSSTPSSFSSSSLSSASASSSSHGSLVAIRKAHDDKVNSQTGEAVRSLTEEESQSAVSLASPALTTPMTLEEKTIMLEIKDALESVVRKMDKKNPDLKKLIFDFADIEFKKGWESGILNKYKEACDMISLNAPRMSGWSFVDRVFQAARIFNLEPYKLKFLYEERQKTSTASSFPSSPSKHHPSSSHSASALAASTQAKTSVADSALDAAVKEIQVLMDTDYKGDGTKLTEADFKSVAAKHGVGHYTLMHAVGL